ncbi:hypothetical protein D3C78_1232470 [compost metagenome]
MGIAISLGISISSSRAASRFALSSAEGVGGFGWGTLSRERVKASNRPSISGISRSSYLAISSGLPLRKAASIGWTGLNSSSKTFRSNSGLMHSTPVTIARICASVNSLMTMSMTPWVRSYMVDSNSSSSDVALRSHWYFQSRFNRRFQCSSRGNLSQRMLPSPETRRAARNVR